MRLLWLFLLVTSFLLQDVARGQSLRSDEMMSPQPESPQKQGLPARAVPVLSLENPNPPDAQIYTPLYRLTAPFYDNVFAVLEPAPLFRPDPASYRSVTAYEPPQGLLPLHPLPGLLSLKLVAGVSESYDSNIQQTATQHIADFYTTLRLNSDIQLGSPDSVYSGYDTILALKVHHEFWVDIFTKNDQFNALNNKLVVDGRVGRSDYIWRPFLTYEDITGSNLLNVERVGRVERQKLLEGLRGDYRFTPLLTWSQTFSHLSFDHPADPQYINFEVYRTYQEIAYRALTNMDVFGWGEYRNTDPTQGSQGNEAMGGMGWRGKPDPRLFSEFLIGWDSIGMSGQVPGRNNRSGIYISGHTSFEWSDRLRLVLKYDRNYTFNELTPNDNYTNSTLQFAPEIFLGGNWYLTPYLGVSYNEYETSHAETLEIRPELELAYQLPNESRCFFKLGYDTTFSVRNAGGAVNISRFSTGFNWRF